MKIYRNIIQQTPEWFEKKKMKFSASKAQAIAAGGKGLETLCLEMIVDKYSNQEKVKYSNDDMDRGNELEPIARSIYELETGNEVEEVGFIEFDKYTGISPDGLVGKDGGLEIKCLNPVNHVKVILFGLKAVETKYIWQVQMSLLLTKRKWWDLVCFNVNLSPSILIFRITPDYRIKKSEDMHEKLKAGLEKGKLLIKELDEKFNGRTKT